MKIKHDKLIGLSILLFLSGFVICYSINNYDNYKKELAVNKTNARMCPKDKISLQMYGLPADDLKFDKHDELNPDNNDEKFYTTAKPVFKNGKPVNLSAVNNFQYIKSGHIRITDRFETPPQKCQEGELTDAIADGYFITEPYTIQLNVQDNQNNKNYTIRRSQDSDYNFYNYRLNKNNKWINADDQAKDWAFSLGDVSVPFECLSTKNMGRGAKHDDEIIIDHGWQQKRHDIDDKTALLHVLQRPIARCNPHASKYTSLISKCALTHFQIYENVEWSTKQIKSVKLSYSLVGWGPTKETHTIEMDNIQTR